jgi:hypothetical protein
LSNEQITTDEALFFAKKREGLPSGTAKSFEAKFIIL